RATAVFERAEGVLRVQAAEHHACALRPVEGLGRRDASVDLQHTTLEHAVLGPCPRKVLYTCHLDPGHVAGDTEAADAVAVGVPREIADERRPPDEHVDELFGVVGVDTEVGLEALT